MNSPSHFRADFNSEEMHLRKEFILFTMLNINVKKAQEKHS